MIQACQQGSGAGQCGNALGVLRFHLFQQQKLLLDRRLAFTRHKMTQRGNGLFTVNKIQHVLRINAAAFGPVNPGALYRRQ
ncbi:hypothetical protein D3C72_1980530 [compost metagenome]